MLQNFCFNNISGEISFGEINFQRKYSTNFKQQNYWQRYIVELTSCATSHFGITVTPCNT